MTATQRLGSVQRAALKGIAAGGASTHHQGQGRMTLHVRMATDPYPERVLDSLLDRGLIELGDARVSGHDVVITAAGRKALRDDRRHRRLAVTTPSADTARHIYPYLLVIVSDDSTVGWDDDTDTPTIGLGIQLSVHLSAGDAHDLLVADHYEPDPAATPENWAAARDAATRWATGRGFTLATPWPTDVPTGDADYTIELLSPT